MKLLCFAATLAIIISLSYQQLSPYALCARGLIQSFNDLKNMYDNALNADTPDRLSIVLCLLNDKFKIAENTTCRLPSPYLVDMCKRAPYLQESGQQYLEMSYFHELEKGTDLTIAHSQCLDALLAGAIGFLETQKLVRTYDKEKNPVFYV